VVQTADIADGAITNANANSDAFKQTEAIVAIKKQLTTEAQQALSGAQAQPEQQPVA
jgi:hypothetical protein